MKYSNQIEETIGSTTILPDSGHLLKSFGRTSSVFAAKRYIAMIQVS